MTNEVGNFFGGQVSVASAADLAADINKSAQNDPRGSDGNSDFLNFSGKRGLYSIGKEGRNVQSDELWVVNIASFEDGFICWKGGRPAATRMANVRSATPVPSPDPEELGPFNKDGEGWYQAKAMVLKSLDSDQQGYFKINSVSGVSAMSGLQKIIAERAIGGDAAWPVVQLDMEQFESNGYKNFKPVFNFYGWLDDENVVKIAEEDADIDALIVASVPGGNPPELEAEPEKPARGRGRRTL